MVANKIGAKNYVDYPWTIKESVFSNNAYTKNIADCTVCGITDGLKVLLIHLCPTNKENFNFNKVIDLIKLYHTYTSNFNTTFFTKTTSPICTS